MEQYLSKDTEEKYHATTTHLEEDKSCGSNKPGGTTMGKLHDLYMSEPVQEGANCCHMLCSLGTISTLCLLFFIIWFLAKVESWLFTCDWTACEVLDDWIPVTQAQVLLLSPIKSERQSSHHHSITVPYSNK